MVENKAKQMKAASPSHSLRSPGTATPTSTTSATPSQVYSERSESERSRESTASPQPITREAPLIETNQRPIADKERSLSSPPGQDRTSPAPPSYSYTPFSDGMTSASASGVVDGLTREEATAKRGKETPPSSPPTSVPEEEPDTSRSTLVDDEGAEEIVGVGGSDDKGHPHQLTDTAPAERVEEEAFVEKEDSLRGDDLSVRSDSISEHYSDMSEEEEEEEGEGEREGEGEGERVEMELPPSDVKPPTDHQTIAASEQYTETFEEPSSSSSSPMPQRTPTPPIEPEGEALMAAATEWEPRPSEEREDEDELLVREDSLEGRNVEELDYQVGQRVLIGNVMSGTIRYVGPTHLAEGVWLGVEMDLPRGRHDGSIDGRRYFSCDPMYGLFAPPEKITVIKEDEEEDDQEDDGGLQPSLDGEVSSVAEELDIEEQLTSEAEQDDQEEEYPMSFNDDDDDKATPQHRHDSPGDVEGTHSPEEGEEEREREEEEEEIVGEEEERSVEGEKEGEKGTKDKEISEDVGQLQLKDEYQWPASEEGTPSPLAEFSNRLEKEIIPSITFDHVTTATSQKQGGVIEQKVEEKTSQITEHPPPASEMLETLGEKSESFPLAPEVANQRSQSATPTPAPPPEFAEGASKETSIEPPPPSPLQLTGDTTSVLKQTSEVISEELAQELTNEAFETMHNIWKVKREVSSRESETKPREDDTSVSVTKEVKQSLDEKADLVTEQLLSLLIQSETNLACSIHNFKKSQEEDAGMVLEKEEEVLSPTSRQHNHQLPRSPLAKDMERPVLSPVPEEPLDDDQLVQGQKEGEEKEKEEEMVTPTVSPRQKHAPAKLILTGSSSIIESSPPPLSPPSPYRTSHFIPSFIPAADEFSPPGSPPKHLSQASAARVAAGEKTPFMASQDKERKSMERSTSTESITSLLDSLKITTAQCMVPSERTNINQVVERSWRVCETIGFEHLHCHPPTCPNDVLDMFSDLHELSPEENHCRRAYLELVFNLTVETLQSLHVQCEDTPIWTQESAVKALLAPEHKNGGTVTLEKVQKKVYKALMRGQLPSQLPAVKFLRGMKRPGGREIDFVDTILIKELREEEPGWIDYCSDEASVKMKTADAILDSLISETVQIMNQIARKRCRESTPS